MAELAGLVLGAAGILVPAYQGYQKCSTVIADTKNFPRNFRTFKLALKAQKDIFSGECELLLKGITDDEVLQKMLRDQEHDRWKDVEFQAAFCSHLGEPLEDKLAPFRIVQEVLDEIFEEVSELEGKMKPGPDLATGSLFMPLAEASRKVKRIGHKVDWALSKKTKLTGLVEILRKQNGVLLQLRNQTEAKSRLRNPQQSQNLKQSATSPFSEYFMVQEVSMKLHKALVGTAACRCHNINLRLDNEPQNSARLNFRFVLTEDRNICVPGQDIAQDQLTCLLIESGLEARDLSVEGSSGDNSCRGPQGALIDISGKNNIARKKADKRTGKRVQFNIDPITVDHGYSSTTESVTSGSLLVTTPTPQKVLEVIDDLCNFLKTSDLETRGSTCLGYVKSDDSYNHIVYKDSPGTLAPDSRISLFSLLSSLDPSEKQKLLPRGDRLKLGLALSLSVLYFGSYTDSWFKEHWRSQDIYFFGDRQQHQISSIGSPHVATSLGYFPKNGPSTENDSKQRTGTTLARNEQLFSLAIVLIEIAYGDLLCNILESGGQRTGESKKLDEIAEYLKAKMVSDFIGREMGKKYADVVRRCLFCDFGVDENDLSKRKLQEMFFTHVVCKLEQCVRQFSD